MKTLQINTERGWRGGESQTLYLSDGLRKRNHETLIVAQPGSPLQKKAEAAGVRVMPVKMRGEFDIPAICKISRIMRKEKIDVCHMHTPHSVSLGASASAIARVPVKVLARRVDFSLKNNPFRKIKYEWGIDKIIAVSKGVRNVLLQSGIAAEKISLIYEGVDLRSKKQELSGEAIRSEFGLMSDASIIGNIAHLTDHKGHTYFLDAIPLVLKVVPGAKFFILGSGELETPLKNQMRELGIEKSVIFTGFRSEVSSFLTFFDIFVMSSHLEGLCTSIIDAMAAGLPVVGTSAGGIPELIQDGVTGVVVPARDPSALAQGIIKLLRNREMMLLMGKAALERAELFSSDIMVENTLSLYKELLHSSL